MMKKSQQDTPQEVVKRPKVVRAQRKFAHGVCKLKEAPHSEQPRAHSHLESQPSQPRVQELPKIPIDRYLNMVTFGNIIYNNPYATMDYAATKPPAETPKKLKQPARKSVPVQEPAPRSRMKKIRSPIQPPTKPIQPQAENSKHNKTINTLQRGVRVLRKHSDNIPKSNKCRLTSLSLLEYPSNINTKEIQSKKLSVITIRHLRNTTKPKEVIQPLSRKGKTPAVKKTVQTTNPVPIRKQVLILPKPKRPDFSLEDEIPLKRTRHTARKTKDKANDYNIKSLSNNLRTVQIEAGLTILPKKKVSRQSGPILPFHVKTRSKTGLLPKKSFTDSDEEPLALKMSDLENGMTKQVTTETKTKTKTGDKNLPMAGIDKIRNKLITAKNVRGKLNGRRVIESQRPVKLKRIVKRNSRIRRPLAQEELLKTKVTPATSGSTAVPSCNSKIDTTETQRKINAVQRKELHITKTQSDTQSELLGFVSSENVVLQKRLRPLAQEELLKTKVTAATSGSTAVPSCNSKIDTTETQRKINAVQRKELHITKTQSDTQSELLGFVSSENVVLQKRLRPLAQEELLKTKVTAATSGSTAVPSCNSKIDTTETLRKINAVQRIELLITKTQSDTQSELLGFVSSENVVLQKRLRANESVEKWLEDQPMPLQEISEPYMSNFNDGIFKRPLVPPTNKTSATNVRPIATSTDSAKHNLPVTNSDIGSTDFELKWSDIVCPSEKSFYAPGELVNFDTMSEYASNAQSRCNGCSSCKRLLSTIRRMERFMAMHDIPIQSAQSASEDVTSNSIPRNMNHNLARAGVPNDTTPTNIYEFENEVDVTPNLDYSIRSNNSPEATKGQGSEDHLFYLRFPAESMKSGLNLDEHLIQAVTVNLPHNKSIVRAKLVNKADVNSKNQPPQSQLVMPNMASVNISQNTLRPKETEQNIPSASISSTLDVNHHLPKRIVQHTPRDHIHPINKLIFPQKNGPAQIVEAPIFRPSEKEFQDPLEFIESITPIAARYGICKIIPPSSFVPECRLSDDMRFKVHNQYIHRMLHRWGPSSREMCAIKQYLATQGVSFANPPLVGGIELDLPKLYHTVQNLGGLNEVIEKKKWPKVVDEMKLPISKPIFARLADIYLKFLLPYDTLSQAERQNIFQEVEKQWLKQEDEMLLHAAHPLDNNYLYEQKPQPEASEPVSSKRDNSVSEMANHREIEDCIIAGKSTTLGSFQKTAKNAMHMHFSKGNNEQSPNPSPAEVESAFWKHVTSREAHVCVNAASIDSGTSGYGFPNNKSKCSPIAKHPWNLKVVTNNSGSVLRSLGGLIGVTVPTIHVGMVFSTCCWYRDPHGLSWIEYLHKGAPKIWYSVPDGQSKKFRHAMEKLVPSFCLGKKIWLPSDMTMVPPSLLVEQDVSLGQTVQQPGEFVVVFPKAYTSSISTGSLVSESVYFAPPTWLQNVHETFKDLRDSCEPTIFSLESLLISMGNDSRWSDSVISEVYTQLARIVEEESKNRLILHKMGVKVVDLSKSRDKKPRNLENVGECDICRKMLYLSLVSNLVDNSDNFCLQHAIFISNQLSAGSLQTTAVYTWTIEELQDILAKLRHRVIL